MSPLTPPLALAGGSLIFVAFIVIMFFAVAYGFYSRRGSAINQHPQGAGRSDNPGVGEGHSRIANSEDETEGNITSHGTG